MRYFQQWVEKFLRDQGTETVVIEPEFLKVISDCVDRGYRWLVFDTIDVGGDLRSHEPVEFRFKTDQLYYPLEISTREHGKTKVDLLLVTPEPLKGFDELTFTVRQEKALTLTNEELLTVSEDWAGFMKSPAMAMQRVNIKGNIRKMKTDFILRH